MIPFKVHGKTYEVPNKGRIHFGNFLLLERKEHYIRKSMQIIYDILHIYDNKYDIVDDFYWYYSVKYDKGVTERTRYFT